MHTANHTQSLYADMALTIADYVYKQLNPESKPVGLNACHMKVEKPLIATNEGPQMFRVAGRYDKTTEKVDFEFYSVSAIGEKTITHAICGVKYEDPDSWLAGWERSTYMVKSRIESLLHGVQNGNNDLIKRGMAYKLFGGLIHYGYKYRGMEEVVLDNAQLEATSSVVFQTNGADDKFFCSPYRIDSVAHLSGFIMLGNDQADTSKEVYVSHGWDTCRFARPLSLGKKYRSYVKMHPERAKMVVGDVYIFEEESVIGVVEGLRVSCTLCQNPSEFQRQRQQQVLEAGPTCKSYWFNHSRILATARRHDFGHCALSGRTLLTMFSFMAYLVNLWILFWLQQGKRKSLQRPLLYQHQSRLRSPR